jgi:hypothetical protein
VTEVMTQMDKAHIIKACARFRSHIESVIAVKGGFIE